MKGIVGMITCLLFSILLSAQELTTTHVDGKIRPASIEVAYDKTTNLIFPYSIISVDRGNSDVLVQKAKGVENVLQLKAAVHSFTETNLTVITGEGALYSFLLHFSQVPKDLNLKVSEMAVPVDKVTILSDNKVNEYDLYHIARRIFSKKSIFSGPRNSRYNMSVRTKGIYVHADALYIQLEIENRSFINFDVDQLRLFLKDKKRTKRTASQEVELKALYIEGNIKRIEGNSAQSVVIVLDKFTIPDKKNFILQIMEQNGGRHLEIKVNNKHLIRAVPIM